ncbi:MAG: 4-(cytidine 5'-diphospho)-2-C-methyl-D-erythritol kinase [Pseudomonadota bacterium]|nr:4-(cytidine 5'-diphospho)-2-C-methyl-D-erythritol kinase [Pseudomonadota bacterium]
MGYAETAYAKINLALHVRRRRDDGYHELETLFAFVDDGDRLEARATDTEALSLHGEFAGALGEGSNNIVMAALAALPHGAPWALRLDKRLPVAAGLGGGSADAGAVFRLVDRSTGLPEGWQAIAAALGADVPACVASRSVVGRGTGTELSAGPDDLAGCPVLLVNPRLPLATGPVFKAWDGQDRGPLRIGSAREMAVSGRNDLEPAAIELCPVIADILAALRETAPWCARMSGSGATCFALYDDAAQRDAAAARISAHHPGWWQMTGALR